MLKAKNIYVQGGTMVNAQAGATVYVRGPDPAIAQGMTLLQDKVVTSALHDSGEVNDPPKCHPNTRVTILDNLVSWASALTYEHSIQWLQGPAGTGKSAIMRSLAERLVDSQLFLASFFFYRSEAERNDSRNFVSTLAYQVSLNIPSCRPYIEKAIEINPLIFRQSLKTQVHKLIVQPILNAFEEGSIEGNQPRVILLDGLDECAGEEKQGEILDLVDYMLATLPTPFAFLIASRPERCIREAFECGNLTPFTYQLLLDQSYFTNMDIKRYYVDSFKKIRERHPLRKHLPKSGGQWPPLAVIEILVKKASGQFVYAVTVIRFVEVRRFNPAQRLEIILGHAPPGKLKPFDELDRLYITIFDSIYEEDREDVLNLVGVMLSQPRFHAYGDAAVCNELEGEDEDVFVPLAEILTGSPIERMRQLLMDVESLLQVSETEHRIKIYHTSLSDFLFNEERSGPYYVDSGIVYAGLVERCLEHCFTDEARILAFIFENIAEFIQKAKFTPELQDAIQSFDFKKFNVGRPVVLRNRVFRILPEILEGLRRSTQPEAQELYAFWRSETKGMLASRVEAYSFHNLLPSLILCCHQVRDLAQLPIDTFMQHPLVPYACAKHFFTMSSSARKAEESEGLAVVPLIIEGNRASFEPKDPFDITASPAFKPEMEEILFEILGDKIHNAHTEGALRILDWLETNPKKLIRRVNYPSMYAESGTLASVALEALQAFLNLSISTRSVHTELVDRLRGSPFPVALVPDEAIQQVIDKYLKMASQDVEDPQHHRGLL